MSEMRKQDYESRNGFANLIQQTGVKTPRGRGCTFIIGN